MTATGTWKETIAVIRKHISLRWVIRLLYIPTIALMLVFITLYDTGGYDEPVFATKRYAIFQKFKDMKASQKKSLGAKISCSKEQMKPSSEVPRDVNHVRPGDIKYIAAMGDSFAIGSHSANYDNEMADVFPGNSFFTGADESVTQHVTIANILRIFNPYIGGVSYGKGYSDSNFNVAREETSSWDLPRQAQELVKRVFMKGGNVWNEWKIIAIFSGIYDLGFLNCRSSRTQMPSWELHYKTNTENAIAVLRAKLNRTIVVVIPILNPAVLIGAQFIVNGYVIQNVATEAPSNVAEKRMSGNRASALKLNPSSGDLTTKMKLMPLDICELGQESVINILAGTHLALPRVSLTTWGATSRHRAALFSYNLAIVRLSRAIVHTIFLCAR
ncbi:hypothetical protein Y032_0019g3912 [Ancylostoma ceylanicum]|uniref:Uncharacterized protein n=1 Tax=Ancylostoma ceylanicum TaxID=53326 RepID=A0A016V4F1_9BILA|nr:hypothetical protein Y032_0019g3912 [Ancylostoma ceylanicum]